MIKKSLINRIVKEELQDSDKFLVDILVKRDNKIFVFIDSDTTFTIQDCVDMTKKIEGKLDRDKEDFELMVSSPGLDYPLKLKRQYVKNKGRKLKVKCTDDTVLSGKLLDVKENSILIKKETSKKNKVSDDAPVEISFDKINEAKVQVSFK